MGMPGISSLMNGCYLFFPAGSRRQVTMPHRMSLERLAHSIQFKVKKKNIRLWLRHRARGWGYTFGTIQSKKETFGIVVGVGNGDGDMPVCGTEQQHVCQPRLCNRWAMCVALTRCSDCYTREEPPNPTVLDVA